MNSPQFESVEAALASLPVEIAPARDLWPAIEQSTGSAGSRRWPLALAAAVALFTLVGALSWSVWRHAPVELVADVPPAAMPRAARPASYELPQDAAYQATRTALARTFAERLALLAPHTRERVQNDLEVIRKANADIRDALRQDPASPVLLQLLRSTWQQEISVYTTVSHSTDPLLTRRS